MRSKAKLIFPDIETLTRPVGTLLVVYNSHVSAIKRIILTQKHKRAIPVAVVQTE
jgi:hypothetical protein